MIKHAVKTPIGWMTHCCTDINCAHLADDCINVNTMTYRSKEECEWYWTHSYSDRYIAPVPLSAWKRMLNWVRVRIRNYT